MKIDTIKLDMDGVIADWRTLAMISYKNGKHGKTMTQLNKDPEFREWVVKEHHKRPGLFDILSGFNSEYYMLRRFLHILNTHRINVDILSATGTDNLDDHLRIADEKSCWLKRQQIHKFIRNVDFVQTSSEKSKFASPTTLLVDDFDQNCNAWHKAGGPSIMHTGLESTIRELAIVLQLPALHSAITIDSFLSNVE